MSRSDSIGETVPRRDSRVLVIQDGVDHQDTLDLMPELSPDRIERVDDVYEAVALAGAIGTGALAGVTDILLHENAIGDAGVVAMMGACVGGKLAKLRCLTLGENQIGEAGMRAIFGPGTSTETISAFVAEASGRDDAGVGASGGWVWEA